MDSLNQDLDKLSRNGNLTRSVQDVQIIVDQLSNARDSIASSRSASAQAVRSLIINSPGVIDKYWSNLSFSLDSAAATVTLAKLQNPVRQSFESVNNDLKEVYKGLGNYSKALDKVRRLHVNST